MALFANSPRCSGASAVKLIFYSSDLQSIDRAAKIAPEKRLGTTFWSIGWVGRD